MKSSSARKRGSHESRSIHGPSDSTAPQKIEPVGTDFVAPNKGDCRQAFYTIPDLAERWHCSRAKVYSVLRGEVVIDFAPRPARRGHKLVRNETVQRIEQQRMKVLR